MTTTAPERVASGVSGDAVGHVTAAVRGSAWREPAYVLCFVGGVVACMFSGNSHHIGFPIGPDRLLFGSAAVLLITDPAARRLVRLRWCTLHTLFAAMLAVAAISALFAGTLTSTYGLFAWLDRLAVPFAACALAPMIFCTMQRRTLLLKTLTVMGIYLGFTGFFEIAGPHALVFPRYIMDPNVGIHFGYARGPFVEAEADGMVMAMCGFCAGLLAARTRGWWRGASVVAIVVCAVGAFLCKERSVWIGTLLGLVVVSLLVPRLRRLLPAVLAGVAVVVAVALLASPSLRTSINGRLHDQRSVYDRQNTYAAAERIIEAKPLFGVGWMRFVSVVPDYVRQAPDYPITNVGIEVHDVYLGRAADLGVPGGLLFVLCVVAGPGRALVRRRPAEAVESVPEADDAHGWYLVFVGVASSWGVVSLVSPLPYALPNVLFWLFAGIALIPVLTRPTSPVRDA